MVDEMSLLDLLAQAGGPTQKSDMARIQIRASETDKGKPVLFDLTAYLNGQVTTLPKLRAGAVIMVPDLPSSPVDMKGQWVQQAPEASIYIMGQVGSPGRYAFNTQMAFLISLRQPTAHRQCGFAQCARQPSPRQGQPREQGEPRPLFRNGR